MKYSSKIVDWKTFEKMIQQVLLMFFMQNKNVQLIFQNIPQTVKNKLPF